MPRNVRWPFARRQLKPNLDAIPEVGEPPADAKPIVELRLQDIGSGSYELPLPDEPEEAGAIESG